MWWLLGIGLAMAGSDPFAGLRDADPGVRAAAAVDARKQPQPDGEAAWRERLEALTAGTSRADASKELGHDEPLHGFGVGSRGASTETWRLDPWWTLVVHLDDDDALLDAPILQRDLEYFWVAPPDGFTGTWIIYFANGARSHEIEYRGGVYEGVFRSFFDNGQLSVQQHYRAGQAVGEDAGWHRSGKPAYVGHYVDGKRDGTWEHWSEDGTLVSRETLQAGELDGVSTRWYPSGQMQSEVHHVHGVQTGRDRAWDEQGTLQWDRTWDRGKLIQ